MKVYIIICLCRTYTEIGKVFKTLEEAEENKNKLLNQGMGSRIGDDIMIIIRDIE